MIGLNNPSSHGEDEWKVYGNFGWCLGIKYVGIGRDHQKLKRSSNLLPNIIFDKKEIKELKDTMHFALVI